MLAYGFDVEVAHPYGVAVETALEDLRRVTDSHDVAARLREARRVGASPDEIFDALGEAPALH